MSKSLDNVFSSEPGEDTIQCFFFTSSLDSDPVFWNQICKNLNESINFLSKDYIWHKDVFKVVMPVNGKSSEGFRPHLTSITTFGDNIEDEWYIVHLIIELTKQYKDLIIKIQDNDGELLLIEAADYLPPWANPETTENRVYIHDSHIHLIPPHLVSLDDELTINEAIQHILKAPDQTRISSDIEQCILNRIGNYPQKIQDNIHKAFVKVPLDLAALLKLKPNLIAPIVNAYCHHDILDAKHFKSISCENWITVLVRFTKCLYAMLVCSKLAKLHQQQIEKDKKTLGLKLACGYHMILKKSSDIFSSKEYTKFLSSLKDNGYFNNNIEGSKEYTIKLENAKQFFSAVECPISSNISHEINQIMDSTEYLQVKKVLLSEINTEEEMEDIDDWLTLDPEQLNEMLNSRYGKKSKFEKGDILTPQNLTNELSKFLKNTSDFEGIETNNRENTDDKIEFDADQFEDCVKKMVRLLTSNEEVDCDDESIDSDMSDSSMIVSDDKNEIDVELKQKLQDKENLSDNSAILKNIIQSMREEKASAGPSSNILSNVGLKKMELLDSDDECD